MTYQTVALWASAAIGIIILSFAAAVLYQIYKGKEGGIDLSRLVSEPDGKASLSRFQFLVFTFVIAGLFLVLSIEAGHFVEIPTNVLGLIGISSGSYVVSKAVGNADAPPAKKNGATSEAATPPAPKTGTS